MKTPSSYAALHVTTNFSFLRGASHPDELVNRAKELGLDAIAVTDRNTLAGIVRMHVAAKKAGLPLLVGARLVLRDAPDLLCYPTDRAAYGRLSRLLSLGQQRTQKGQCDLALEDAAAFQQGLFFIILPPRTSQYDAFKEHLAQLRQKLQHPLYLALPHHFRGDEAERFAALQDLSELCQIPLIATS